MKLEKAGGWHNAVDRQVVQARSVDHSKLKKKKKGAKIGLDNKIRCGM